MKKFVLVFSAALVSFVALPSFAMNLMGQRESGNMYGTRSFDVSRYADGSVQVNTYGMENSYGNPETVTSFNSAYRASTGQYTVSYTVEFSMDEELDFGLRESDWGDEGGGGVTANLYKD